MVRINLLPIRDILRKRELKHFVIFAAAALAVAMVVAILTYTVFALQISSLQAEKAKKDKELAALKEKNKRIEALKNDIARKQRQVDTIERLTKTRDTPAPFLGALSLAVPDEVWLGNIGKTGKNFSLDGTGLDNTVVVNFVQRLQKIRQGFTPRQPFLNPADPNDLSFFSDVKLQQIVAGKKAGGLGVMEFKITGSLR